MGKISNYYNSNYKKKSQNSINKNRFILAAEKLKREKEMRIANNQQKIANKFNAENILKGERGMFAGVEPQREQVNQVISDNETNVPQGNEIVKTIKTTNKPKESFSTKINNFLKPHEKVRATDVIRELPQAMETTFSKGVGLVSGIFGGIIGGLTGGTISTLSQGITKGDVDYSKVMKDTINMAKETSHFGKETGEKGAKIAPLAPVMNEVILYGAGKGMIDTLKETDKVYQENKNKPNAKLRTVYEGLKKGGEEGYKLIGMDDQLAKQLSNTTIGAGVGNAILYGSAFLATRGVARDTNTMAKKLPFVKVKPTGDSIVVPADTVLKKYIKKKLENTKLSVKTTKEGVEIFSPKMKLKPEQIAKIVKKSPHLKGFFEIKEYRKTPFGRLFDDVGLKGFKGNKRFYTGKYRNEPFLNRKNVETPPYKPTTGYKPDFTMGRGETKPAYPNFTMAERTPFSYEGVREIPPTRPKAKLPVMPIIPKLKVGTTIDVPAQNNQNLSFQILDEKIINSLKRFQKKLEKARDEKNKLIKKRINTPANLKVVQTIQNNIDKIKQKIAIRKNKQAILSGPIRKGEIKIKDKGIKIPLKKEVKIKETKPEINEKILKENKEKEIKKSKQAKTTNSEKSNIDIIKENIKKKASTEIPSSTKIEIKKKKNPYKKKRFKKQLTYKERLEKAEKLEKQKKKKKITMADLTPEQIRARIAMEAQIKKPMKEGDMDRLTIKASKLSKEEAIKIREQFDKSKERPNNITIKKQLEKELAEGKDQNYFTQKAFDLFVEGKTKESEAVDAFIEKRFKNEEYSPEIKERYNLRKKGGINIFKRILNRGKSGGEFNLKNEALNLILKYGNLVSERYTPRKAKGISFNKTYNVSVGSLTDLTTVIHELTHVIDRNGDLAKKLLKNKNLYQQEINELRKIYQKYYPTAKGHHNNQKQITEGLATLAELKIAEPKIADKYKVSKALFNKNGYLHNPLYENLIKDGKDLVERYSDLDSLRKIGARMQSESPIDLERKGFLNLADKIRLQTSDYSWILGKMAKKADVELTKDDPHIWLLNHNRAIRIAKRNITDKKFGYWTYNNKGDAVKTYDYNWASLVSRLHRENAETEFGWLLLSRKSYYEYQELKKMFDPKEREALQRILKNNKISEEEATEAYLKNKNRFKEELEMYDNLVREDLKLLHNPLVRKVDDETFKKWSDKKGYAPRLRTILDEFGDPDSSIRIVNRGTAINSLMTEKGSEKEIVNPLEGAIRNHLQIFNKANKQIVYNKLYEMQKDFPFPELLQVVPVKPINVNGKVILKNEKNTKVIYPIDKNYKVKVMVIDKEIQKVLAQAFDIDSLELMERIARKITKTYVKGTTGAYLPYTIINTMLDSISAFAQSRNKVYPIISSINQSIKLLLEKFEGQSSEEKEILYSFFANGGHFNTFIRSRDDTPQEFFKKISKERTLFGDFVEGLNTSLNIITIPQQGSEIMNRYAEYYKAIKSGKPQIVALEEAALITGPFRNMGRWGGKLGRTVVQTEPFMNAQIQILYRYLDAARDKKTQSRLLFTLAAIMAMQITSYVMLWKSLKKAKRLGGDAYSKAKKVFNQRSGLSVYEQGNYIMFSSPFGNGTLKVRIPGEQGILGGSLGMEFFNKYGGSNYNGEDFANIVINGFLPQQLNPLDDGWIFSVIPLPLRQAVATKANRNIFPRVSLLEPDWMKYKEPKDRYYDDTNNLAIMIGRKFNLSPLKIESLIKGYGGRNIDMLTENIRRDGDTVIKGLKQRFARTIIKKDYMFSGKTYDDFKLKTREIQQKYPSNKKKYRRSYQIVNKTSKIVRDFNKLKFQKVKIPLEYINDLTDIMKAVNKEDYKKARDIYNGLLRKKVETFLWRNRDLLKKKRSN